jgi:hypothetical protein
MQGVKNPGKPVGIIGRVLVVLGALMMVVGLFMTIFVSAQLSSEKISISGDTPFMSAIYGSKEGETPKMIKGPLGAYAQSEVIKMHTQGMPEGFGFPEYNGMTAAQIAQHRSAGDYPGADTEEGKAKMDALWNMMNISSFLRSSLLLSAMASGVGILIIGVGVVTLLGGWALVKVSKFEKAATEGPDVIVEAAQSATV